MVFMFLLCIIQNQIIYFYSNISQNIAYLEQLDYNKPKNPVFQNKSWKGYIMEELTSCRQAIENCLATHTFSIAHLYKEEKAMDMHIHDCYELYYSISGGRQFLIDNRFYSIASGDLFIINQYESHKLTQIDSCVHERIVLSIHPEYVKTLSTAETDLDYCFSHREGEISHKLSLSKEQQKRFLYFVGKMLSAKGYAHDIIEQAAFMELLSLINYLFKTSCRRQPAKTPDKELSGYKYNRQVDDILSYINRNISAPITIDTLAGEFFLSESYICRIFKSATGTTINKYITARRISIAKALLNEGAGVGEAFEKSGFADYSNFFKAFTKAVGISPKKYAGLSVS